MAYGDFKDLARRTAADKMLSVKHLILLKIQNKMDINAELLQWFINFLIKKILVAVLKIKLFLINNQQKNYTKQLLEYLIKGKHNHLL